MISIHANPLAKLGGKEMGGQSVYILELGKHLARLGWKVDIFTRMTRKRTKKVTRVAKNLNVIYLKAGPRYETPKEKYFKKLPEFVANFLHYKEKHKLEYSVIHGHYYNGGWVAGHIKKMLRVPMVQTFHTLGYIRHRALQKFVKEDLEMTPSLEERIMAEKEAMKAADKIIATNPSEKQNIVRYYDFGLKDKIATLPCGVNFQKFKKIKKEKARVDRNFSPDEKIILYIGRIDPLKGIDVIIKSLPSVIKEFAKRGEKVRFIVIGGKLGKRGNRDDIAEVEKLKQLAKDFNVDKHVVFRGKRSQEKLRYYYSGADVFVTTPYYETFGMTALEAMRCGVPVIASNVGGFPTIIEDEKDGLLFPAGDHKALSKKLIRLLKNEKLQNTLIQNGEEKVRESFGWSKIASDMSDLYRDLPTK